MRPSENLHFCEQVSEDLRVDAVAAAAPREGCGRNLEPGVKDAAQARELAALCPTGGSIVLVPVMQTDSM